jgi:hypothetical protein
MEDLNLKYIGYTALIALAVVFTYDRVLKNYIPGA